MIGFLQPLALLGLAAVAIPPLLHLIGRRLPPTVVFPAVRYLTATEREHSRKLKLRNLLLLLLRMAVILLVVLAAARPVARVGSGGGHAATALALVLDNSLSSGAVLEGQRVLDVLVERARAVLARTGPDDRIWLVTADGRPRRMGRSDAMSALDSLAPLPVRLDLAEAARTAARAVSREDVAAAEVVVLSDLQATALSAGEPAAAPVLLREPPDPPPNRSVDSARAEPALWSPTGEVVVQLGGTFAEPAALRLEAQGRTLAGAVAGTDDLVILAATAPRRGWLAARVALDPDELRADDEWWLALRAADPAPARVVGELGRFVPDAIAVLRDGGRLAEGDGVSLADRVMPGTTVLLPPADPALVGALNRTLAARGVPWRLAERLEGEWRLPAELGAAAGSAVYRRHRLLGDGPVVARVAGEPWLVRFGDVVIVASRMEPDWTELPVSAAFVPLLDFLINRVAAGEAWTVRAAPGQAVRLPDAARAVWGPHGTAPVGADGRAAAPLEEGVFYLSGAGGDTVGALEVNHDRRESRLTPATRAEVRATLGDEARVLDDRALDRELFGGERRADLSGMLLAAAIIAALAELGLATAGGGRSRA